MKTFLPWLVALLALGSAYFFHAAQRSKSAELAELKQQLVELERLRAENEELKAGRVSSDEMNRLRKNTEDLLRLRNEVRQLRDDKQQLSQQASAAQAQAEQARAQTQAAQAQAQALATNAALSPEALRVQQALQQRYGLVMTPEQAQANACLNQLRQLDGAKQQWALEKQKPVGTQPTWEDIAAYLKDGVLPACPAGGSHTLNSVGIAPTCSLPGHALPQ